jgi:plastocyanin
VTFTFTEYSPKCIRIAAGQSVTFSGSFLSHPLVGGEVVNGTKTPDPTSPIPTTTSGTMRAVSFPAGGVFSYYCDVHALSPFDMVGAVFVDP